MMTLMALTNLAGLRYVHGQLRLAIASCQQVLDLANQRIGRPTPLVGKTLFNLGEMLREQGDLEAGLKYLLEAAEMMAVFSEVGLPLVWLAIARINVHQNDWPAATASLVKARKYAQVSRTTLMDDRLVDLMQVRFWLWRGELRLVDEWAQERGLLGKSPAEVLAEAGKNVPVYEIFLAEIILMIRLALAHHQFDWVIEMVSLLLKPGEKKINRRRLLEILILESLAFDQAGKTDLALRTLGEALALAEPEGYQRIFIDEGEPLARLLYLCTEQKISPVYAGRLLSAYSREPSRTVSARKTADDELIEPLSGRELEVLELIARGFTNHEVAGSLSISLSTVKGHLTNIFNKLNVHNRTQAVARARSLGLLPPG
jgi:LuxR family maltose regulon positive regulatory protein